MKNRNGLALIAVGLLALACGLTTRQSWRSSLGPVVPHDSFPAQCDLCHLGGDWSQIRPDFDYDHAKQTGTPLLGAHEQAQCLRCHNDRGPVKVFAQRGCGGCHEDVHQGHLGKDCKTCHDETNWLPRAQIAKHASTRFPLVGAHAATACFRCHPGAEVGNFQRTDPRCESCHQQDLTRATNPDHQQRGWTTACERCHLPTVWQSARFSHDTYPLTGRHGSISCSRCHVNNVYAGTPRTCVGCHQANYNATTNPRHAQAGFSTACDSCHTTSSWFGARYTHLNYTLTGAHLTASCASCHANGVYAGTPRNCAGCHLPDYNATTSPNHQAANFPTTCETCHSSTSTWRGATFNHSFPITTGKHSGISCGTCHTNPNNYQVFTCLVCHEHNKTKMDDTHKSTGGYSYTSAACLQCHPQGRK